MMNYVGSISIIDRGDAPAQAVIDKNVRSLAQRVADETKDELDKVMDRVDNIYVSYEMSTQTMFENPRASPNVEYIEDIKELEEIIKDTVKKKKYQKQVTIFIVGFQDVCSEKMQLLQQVNQFFLDNSQLDEEELAAEKPDIDMDECSNKINESLKTAEDLTKKLGDLNQDIIEWLVNWANTKASNKTPSAMLNYDKGKKRLEKSLETAKNDMTSLQEKLLNLQTELEEKDEKFQQMAKQLESKAQESLRYKTAAEVAKKSAQDNESHTSTLQNEISVRDDKIKELRQKLSRMEINLSESQFDTQLHQKRFDNKHAEAQKLEENGRHRLEALQEEVQTKKIAVVEAEREMDKLHRDQLTNMEQAHKQEIDELKAEHQAELTRLTDQVKSLHGQLSDAERHAQQAFDETDQLRASIIELQLRESPREKLTKEPRSRDSSARLSSGKSYGDQSAGEDEHPTSKQESRPSTKDTKSSKRSEVKAKIPSRSPNRIVKEKSGPRTTVSKEYAEASQQDEDGDHLKAFVQKSNEPSRQPTRQSKNLQPVEEIINFDDVFDLEDEESWATVPAQHVPGRFSQYRKLSAARVKELQDQLNITLTKTHRKVNSLKSQFTEHKKKWESERKVLIEQVEQAQKLQTEAEKEADAAMTQLDSERKVLIEQVEQAQKLQTEAEKEADAAMTQLEEFINEQEKLEDEEETKRQEVLKAMSRPGTVGPATPTIAEPKEEGKGDGEEITVEGSDQELKKLMQQTDDAKVLDEADNVIEVESRTGTSMTYDSGASQLAPWLNPTTTRRPPTKDGNQSSSGSPPDPFSRMTSAVDAEIQQVIAPEEMQLLAIEDGRISEKLPQIQDGRSRSASGQDLPKSRPSSKIGLKSRASTKLPRIYTSVHIDEEDEEAEKPPDDSDEEPEGSDTLAPWMTPAGVKKERRSARSRSPRSQMSGHNETGEIDIEQDVVVSRARSSKVRSDSRPVSKSSLRDTEGQKSITPGVQAEKKETAESDRMTQSGRKKSKSRSELQATDEQNLSEASTDNLSKLRATPQLEQSDEASYSESKEETLNQGNLESVQTKTDIDKERSRTLDPEEKLKRSRTHKERSRSPRKRSALDKEHSRLAQRSKTSFEKPKTPEVRPRSFMSERDESEDDVHKDSGIEQSEVSDAQSEKIVLRERTRTVLSRSSRKRSSSSAKLNQESKSLTVDTSQGDLETSEDPSLTMQSNSDSKSPTLQSKSLSKSSVRRSDADGTVSLDDGIPSENVSTTEKSKSDDAKINDGTVSRSKTKSASQKASLLDNEQLSRMTDESEHIELDSALSVVDNAFEEDDEFEEELNLPGMSAIGAESVTDDMKTSRSSRVRSTQDADAAEKDIRKSKLSSDFTPQESGRSGAQINLVKQNEEVRHTIQSERRPSITTSSTVSPRKMVVTVDVLADSEVQASRTSGAISAPPAVEPDEDTQHIKEPETVREDYESRPIISPDRMRTATPSTNSTISEEPPSATPKKAFATPRVPSVLAPSLRLSSSSSSTMSEVDLDIDEGVALDLAPTQTDALNSLKTMMSEENLTFEQQKTLDSLRSAIKSVTDHDAMKDLQLERTVTILSLASQIARESVELEIVPDSVFNSFANMDSRAMSALTDSRMKLLSSETDKMLRSGYSTRKDSVILEQFTTDGTDNEEIEVDKSGQQTAKERIVVPQEKSTRHREPSASKQRQKSASKERKQKEKPRKRESSSLTISGSLDLDNISSRGLDSFSASLPRTCPSTDWQEMSQDATFSPIKPAYQTSFIELRKELVTRGTQSELSGDDLQIIGKGIFVIKTASPKKKRPITKEEMLYGETSMHVGPTGRETEHDIMAMDDKSVSSSRSDQQLSEKKESSLSLPSDPFKDSPLPQTPKSVTRSSRILTPTTPGQRSRSRSRSAVSSLDGDILQQSSDQALGTRTPHQQVPPYTPVTPRTPQQQVPTYTPVTPAESVTSVIRPMSPESYHGEPSFLTSSTSHQVLVTTPTPDRTPLNSPVPRPVSISSVHPTFDLPPPPELCKATQTEPIKWSEVLISMTKIEHEPVKGKTEDEIRVSSAKSRASLRNQFKSRLEETRNVVEDRRANTPAISIPSQKSLDEDQLIIDEDDDDLPIPDDMKVEDVIVTEDTLEAGTSPPPGIKPQQHAETQVSRATSKQSVNLAEHPVVQEYLKTYRGVHNFKDAISRLLEDKDQMSASQILADLDTVPFDQSVQVQPQLENMTDNVYYVLNEISQVVNSIIHNDRGPVVSSLMMGMSRDPTQRSMIRERSSESVDIRQGTQQSQRSVKVGPSPSVERQQYRELQEKYENLQGQLSEEAKNYEEQLRHNTVVMMEMQDTINDLQRELSALGKTARRPLSDGVSTPGGGSQNAESAVMFTRLDSDRNAKIMKKAVVEEKLDPGSYKEAMVQMDEYINLPAQRLAHLVRKYVHHCRMKEIEENVKKSTSLNENVFNILDKMEELQNKRAKQWADRMDEMGMERLRIASELMETLDTIEQQSGIFLIKPMYSYRGRLRIASELMETLDTIEQQSGIFLIKPMYSYRGREPKEHFSGKISRPFRATRVMSPSREVQSAYAPAPTPASNVRAMVRAQEKPPELPQLSQEQPPPAVKSEPQRPLEGDSSGLMGASVSWMGTQPKTTWSMSDSQPRGDGSLMMANLNTPRILELDINRMMIGQNTISAQIGNAGISNDRLVNASNSNLRSYMTVNRPAVAPSGSGKERPSSGGRHQDSPAPPSSPVVAGTTKGVRIPNDQFPGTPPLPPIGSGSLQGRVTPRGGKGRQSPREPSISPPGSSLRQTPPNTSIDIEIIPTKKS